MSSLSYLSNVDQFLSHCSQSSSHAFAAFTELLENLHAPQTRKKTRQFLASLHQAWLNWEQQQDCYFSFVTQRIKTANSDLAKGEALSGLRKQTLRDRVFLDF